MPTRGSKRSSGSMSRSSPSRSGRSSSGSRSRSLRSGSRRPSAGRVKAAARARKMKVVRGLAAIQPGGRGPIKNRPSARRILRK